LALSPSQADWLPTTGGTYNYGTAGNWTGGNINNVFLSSSYSGTAQTVTIGSDGIWNAVAPVVTSHGNGTNLLIQASGSDRSLALTDINYTALTNNAANQLQFGTITANQKINFTLSGDHSIHVSSPQTVSTDVAVNSVIFNGVLSGTGGITKTGNGSLYLQNAASTFAGDLNVQAGRVVLTSSTATLATQNIILGRADLPNSSRNTAFGTLILGNDLAPLGTSSGTAGANSNRISDTATIRLRGGSLSLGGPADGNTLSETVGTVALEKGASSLLISRARGTNTTTLNVTNLTRTAGTTLTVAATDNGAQTKVLGTDGKVTVGTINGGAVADSLVNGILPWAVNAAGAQGNNVYGDFLTYDNTNGFVALSSFTTDINTATSSSNLKLSSGTYNISGNRSANSLTLSDANISNAGGFTLTLTSGAINQYTGYIGNANSVAANLNFNAREAIIFVQRNLGLTLSGNLSNTDGNGLTFNGIGYALSGATPYLRLSGTNTYTGQTTVNSGILQIRSATALPTASAVVINEGGGVELGRNNVSMASLSGVGYVEFAETGTVGSGSSTLTVGSDNTDTEYAGIIRNGGDGTYTGNVTKTGTGSLTLTGNSTYTGATLVSNGTLIVNGSITSSSQVTVQNGATLGGTGSVSSIILASGAELAPGADLSTLQAASLSWSGGATLSFELSSTTANSSLLDLSGAFTKAGPGSYVFDFLGGGFYNGLTATSYTLVNFDMTDFSVGDFSFVNLQSGLTGSFQIEDNALLFNVTAIPEPAYSLMILGSLTAMLLRRKAFRKVRA